MLGDEAQPAESTGPGRATSGPRHAAPRKSLLTKLHMPAGKAVALAAMPTAVLMGMGFTPHLAQADELPKSPYKPGPCVTQPETPAPSATKSGDAESGGKATPEPTTSPSASGTKDEDTPKPATSPSPADAATSQPKSQPTTAPTTAPAATPSPSATKSVNPLDPLGLGDVLGGLLGLGGSSSTQPTASPTPTPSATQSAKPTASPTPKAPDPVKSTVDGVTMTVKGATGAVKDTTGTAKKTAKDLTGAAKSAASSADPKSTDPAAGYPCPTYDAKALAAAETEQGIPLLPDQPWVLKSSLLTLYGLKYDGIVQVRTYSGTVKDVLKFTATGIDIGDLHQIVNGPKGTKTHVTARSGSTSTIRNGTVTMYTESLSGNLLGAVPVTFTPKAPPPLTLPVLFFTDVTVIQAGQFGGDLTVPGMKVAPGQSS